MNNTDKIAKFDGRKALLAWSIVLSLLMSSAQAGRVQSPNLQPLNDRLRLQRAFLNQYCTGCHNRKQRQPASCSTKWM
jgi:hypothetical protein